MEYLLKANYLVDSRHSSHKSPNSTISIYKSEQDALNEAKRLMETYPCELDPGRYAHLVQLRIYELKEY